MESSLVQWHVHHPVFCLEESRDLCVMSPEFSTFSRRWKLLLHVNRKKGTVSLCVEHDNSNLSIILLNYTLRFFFDDASAGPELRARMHLTMHRGGFADFMKYSDLKTQFVESKILKLHLKINAYTLVAGPDPAKMYLMFTPTTNGFLNLSADFLKLYESKHFSDLVIKLKDGQVSCHKAILGARSGAFFRHLKTTDSKITLHNYTLKIFRQLLSLIYTGKLAVDSFLCPKSTEFRNFLESFHVSEVDQSQCQPYLILKGGTSIYMNKYKLPWDVLNFSRLKGTVKSQLLTDNASEWRIELEVRYDYLGIFTRKMGGIAEPNHITRLTVMLLESSTTSKTIAPSFQLSKYFQFPKLGDRIGFDRFIKTKTLKEMASTTLQGDCLKVLCYLDVSEGDTMGKRTGTAEWLIPPISSSSSFTGDFGKLLASGIFSDMVVVAEDKSFNVHRSILAARSPVFLSIIKEVNPNAPLTLKFSGMTPTTLELMIMYVYTGGIGAICSHAAIELYIAAEKYLISELRDRCSFILPSLLTVSEVCKVLVMAHEHKDAQLKQNVINFIGCNLLEVMKSPSWRLLTDYSESLAKKVCRTFAEAWVNGDVRFDKNISKIITGTKV